MNRLLLIDGHSVAYRAFYALPVENFATSTGQSTNAVFGFTSMLINVLRDEAPTHVAVAFDVSRRSFRTDEYPEYKATRSASPPEFSGQVDLIKEVLDALDIVHLEKEGFEADDIIATLATQAEAEGLQVLICTGDRDALQLVTDATTVLYPRKGVSDLARMTPAAVEEKYLVPPARHPEVAALVGETSDNLPGVPGVGPKTAAKWITAYDGLDQVIARADEIGGKAGQSLRDHLAEVIRNRRLNALVTDLALEVTPAELSLNRAVDPTKVHDLFDALEFTALRTRLSQVFTVADAAVEVQQKPLATTVIEPGGLSDWLRERDTDRWGVHLNGAWGRGTGTIDSVALSTPHEAAWFEVASLTPEDDETWAAWLADETIAKAVHDAKGPMLALAAHGWRLRGVAADTALSAYLVRPDQRAYVLEDLVRTHLGRELEPDAGTDGQLVLDVSAGAEHDARTAQAVLELSFALDAAVESAGGADLLRDVELPLTAVLAEMERTGIAVDDAILANLETDFADRANQAAEAAFAEIGTQINLSSPKQLQVVLFEQLQMPKTKRTKTGWTTDAEALQQLLVKTGHPFLTHLLTHRDATKLRQTVETLRKTMCDDGRVHTTFSQTTAATGRLSSNDPNVQNIPIRTPSGRRIREAFVPGPDYDVLLTADYSQIEMRIMAHLSGESDLIDAFTAGEDFHTVMAARVFGKDPEDIDGELRARIKAMNYGLAYGLSAYGLSQQLAISPGEAQKLMDEYFERFGRVRDYLQGLVDEARRTGWTETIMGRRRYLPDLHSDTRQRREMAERMALNAPIQGSAADLIKVAMLRVDRELREADLQSRMLLQVHDELVLEVTAAERDQVQELLVTQMEGAVELAVPLSVSVGVGPNWFAAGH